MDSKKGIEYEGINNVICEPMGMDESNSFRTSKEGGDESYSDSAKTTLKVRELKGPGMGEK